MQGGRQIPYTSRLPFSLPRHENGRRDGVARAHSLGRVNRPSCRMAAEAFGFGYLRVWLIEYTEVTMNLELDPSVASGYSSKGYITGLISESWAANNLYCVNCQSDKLTQERPNAPVRDFACPVCKVTYQLKAKSGKFGAKVANSAYSKKISAIEEGTVPHYAFLNYDRASWIVTDLFVVPGHLIGRGSIQRRNPLGPKARRAGWVGSSILLGDVPEDGRIWIVSGNSISNPSDVRKKWQRMAFLGTDVRASRGWGADVYSRVCRLVQESGNREFTLRSFYFRFLTELAEIHSENHHLREKVRQQMQVLRNGGLLEFVDNRGTYRLLI